ncbi:MAG TPA: LytTR family DNA-binding domain-containing protein [Prolixibacteraceae bacterium]|nr:LytTR family DNA-binding domain-containing protein [Prolixibacteraceae bacterium]
MMYKVVIIEDDRELAHSLEKIIRAEAPFFEVKGVAPSISEGEKLIRQVQPDVAFFDVELEDGLSFDLLEKLPEVNFEIIFVTAYSHYALNAFRYSAIDFVVKPVDPDDIRRVSEKAVDSLVKKDIQERINNLIFNTKAETMNQRLLLQTAGSLYFIPLNDIVRCESDINYTTFVLASGKTIVVSKSIGEFEKMLPPCFFRVHRSHLINLKYVIEVKKRSGVALLSNKEKIEISVRKKDAFLQAMKELCS